MAIYILSQGTEKDNMFHTSGLIGSLFYSVSLPLPKNLPGVNASGLHRASGMDTPLINKWRRGNRSPTELSAVSNEGSHRSDK